MVPYPIEFNRTGWTFKEDYRPLLYFTLHNVSKMALRMPAFLRRVTESFSNGLRKNVPPVTILHFLTGATIRQVLMLSNFKS